MIGGLLKSTSRFAIVAAAGAFIGGMALTPANAADLGGDCCADLEERVADLEATTARKGNRKVSLKISGQVNRMISWIEDEDGQSEFGSLTNSVSDNEVKFKGSAKLTSSWTAGFVVEVEFNQNRSSDWVSDSGTPGGHGTDENGDIDKSYVYLSNAQLGTIALGYAGAPTNGVDNISLAGRGVTGDSAGDSWNGVANGFDLGEGTHEAIAYISPTFAGFTVAAAWADLDVDNGASDNSAVDALDIALRYANEFGPIRVAAGIGYTTTDDDELGDGSKWMGSAALMHTPTGLNVAFAYGAEIDGGLPGGVGDGTSEAKFWHVEGGISQNFTGLGATSIYGEYGSYDQGIAASADDTTTMYGFGAVQKFDSAATELYIAYRNWQDDDFNDDGTTEDGDVSQVIAGMKIKF